MEQQFSLSWREFQGNLSSGCARLLGTGEFADVTLAAEGKLLQAHRLVLSICSPYFQKMFHANPCQHPIVVLKDISYDALKDLLQFMYNGEVSVKQEDLTNFISTAESLEIKGLTNNLSKDDDLDNIPKQCSTKADNLYNNEKNENFNDNAIDKNVKNSNKLNSQQIELLNQINNLSSLKRKSESFLSPNKYFSINDVATEKRPKLREKQILNRHKLSNNQARDLSTNKEIPTLSFNSNNEISNKIVDAGKNFEESHIASNSQNRKSIDNMIEVKRESEDVESDSTYDESTRNPDLTNDENESHLDDIQLPQSPILLPGSNPPAAESSLPTRYRYIYSRKGHKQLVHMNFVYTKHSTSNGKTSWRCVQYFTLNRCPATVETFGSVIYAVNHFHNHEDCFDKILRNSVFEMEEIKDS